MKILEEEDTDMEGTNVRGGARVLVYDWLRLIATIFVVIGHSAYLSIHTTYGGVEYQLPETVNRIYYAGFMRWLRSMSGWVYGFHMPLFFMLSGAAFALKPIGSFDEVIRNKFRRLIIPYFVFGWFFMLPVKRLGNFYDNESLLNALKGFLSGLDSGHLWFLTALFWCIVVFTAGEKILSKFRINSMYALLMIAGVIQLTYTYLPFNVLGLKKGLSYIFFFAMGFCFEKERELRLNGGLRMSLTFCTGLLLLEIVNHKYGILNDFFVIVCGSAMTYFLSDILSRLFSKVSQYKIWRIIIRNLFYVYLLHDPLEYIVLRVFMGRQLLSGALGCIMYVLSRTVIIFGGAIVAGELVTRAKEQLRAR